MIGLAIGAIATMQSFVRESYETRRYRDGVERAFARTLAMVRWRSWFYSTAMTAGFVGVAAVIWLGGGQLAHARNPRPPDRWRNALRSSASAKAKTAAPRASRTICGMAVSR